MKVYGIVVEGEYDELALTEMIRKCCQSEIEIFSRKCGGKKQLIKKFPRLLKSFCHQKQGSYVDKALVILDADGQDAKKLKEIMTNRIADKNYRFDVKFIVITQELEAWLLADEEAISKVTSSRSGRTVVRISENLESIIHPKEKLREILSGAKVYYAPEVARGIAKEADLSKIESRCRTFGEFLQAVKDC